MSSRSRPRRSKLSSSERRMPSRLKSQTPPVGSRHDEALIVQPAGDVDGLEHASDLRREHVVVARTRGERGSQPPFREAEPVVRCRVEVAHPEFPGCVDGAAGVGVRYFPVHVPELRAAERKLAQRKGPIGKPGASGSAS